MPPPTRSCCRAAVGDEDVRPRFASVDRAVFEQAYNVIANPFLWFLQHQMWNLPERPIIDAGVMRAWERGYVAVNRAFAAAILAQSRGDREPRVMLHDYHLYLAAEPIRRARPKAVLSHFTHIPWPPSSIWLTITPSIREAIATGLLANDVVGFQTPRYAHNFLRMAESFVPGAVVDYEASTVRRRRRTTHVRTYPISIDVEATLRVARSRAARRRADQLLGGTREQVIVRVDRLEPSKNILRGFLAYETLLQRQPRLRGRISFLAFLVPSRTGLREYGQYGRQVQNAVDRINARFGRAGWRPGPAVLRERLRPGARRPLDRRCRARQPARRRHEPGRQGGGRRLRARRGARPVRDRRRVRPDGRRGHSPSPRPTWSAPPMPSPPALAMAPAERRRRLEKLRRGVEREDITWWLRSQLRDLAELTG